MGSKVHLFVILGLQVAAILLGFCQSVEAQELAPVLSPGEYYAGANSGSLAPGSQFTPRIFSSHAKSNRSWLDYAPTMLGDGFFSRTGPINGPVSLDRLFVAATDLDLPVILPPVGAPITLSEAGPVGIFSSSLGSAHDIQAALRNGTPLPPATLVSTIADNATMTTAVTLGEAQALLAATGVAFDLVPIVAPPGTYNAAVDGAFVTRNGSVGATTYRSVFSGALLQAGADSITGAEDFDAFYFYDYLVNVGIPTPHAAAVRSGVLKASEGNQTLPRNRVFFQYAFFDQVGLHQGAGASRFMPGFERTLFDGLCSIEMRFPFTSAMTDSMVVSPGGIGGGTDLQWGNVTAFLKVLMNRTNSFAWSCGVAASVPTADNLEIQLSDGTPWLALKNEAVHVGPFLSALYAPNDRFFLQTFGQLDFSTNGNPLLLNLDGASLVQAGSLTDTAYAFIDAQVGYWVNSPSTSRHPLALLAEFHYNAALNNSDVIQTGGFQVGAASADANTLNLTAGASLQLGQQSRVFRRVRRSAHRRPV